MNSSSKAFMRSSPMVLRYTVFTKRRADGPRSTVALVTGLIKLQDQANVGIKSRAACLHCILKCGGLIITRPTAPTTYNYQNYL